MDKSASDMHQGTVAEVLRTLSEEAIDLVSHSDELSYETLVSYLERRSMQFERLQSHEWTDDEKVQGMPYVKQILAADPAIRQMMSNFKQEAAKELEQIHGARKQQSGYEQQAQLQQPLESLFFDQKK